MNALENHNLKDKTTNTKQKDILFKLIAFIPNICCRLKINK